LFSFVGKVIGGRLTLAIRMRRIDSHDTRVILRIFLFNTNRLRWRSTAPDDASLFFVFLLQVGV
jgi:hypothetical protein